MTYAGSVQGLDVERYDEIEEILRGREFVPHQPDRQEFLGGSILLVGGQKHWERRRMEAALFAKAAIVHYERETLVPTIQEVLATAIGAVSQRSWSIWSRSCATCCTASPQP